MKILEAKNITKMFPGVVALDSVDVAFEPGEIHAIIGENGAGKSTLIKCLTGVYEPEEGEVLIEGENAIKNKALFDKVAYVPQEIDLFNYMSVAENLFMPYEKSGIKGTVNQKELEERAIPILEKFSIPIRPNELVKDISVSSQQLLQIARATVHEDYDVLMLDEPTTSLTSRDTEILFDIIRKIKEENKAIIFISHKLEEIFLLANVITVFRNGKKVAFSPTKDVDTNWVIRQMTGHERTYAGDLWLSPGLCRIRQAGRSGLETGRHQLFCETWTGLSSGGTEKAGHPSGALYPGEYLGVCA